jgi:hypothetical protein
MSRRALQRAKVELFLKSAERSRTNLTRNAPVAQPTGGDMRNPVRIAPSLETVKPSNYFALVRAAVRSDSLMDYFPSALQSDAVFAWLYAGHAGGTIQGGVPQRHVLEQVEATCGI